MVQNYRKTLLACYLGFVTQAITANFAPLLFLKFHTDYNIPLGKIALIPGTFFVTQLIIDVLCARFADRIGYRRCAVASEVCSAAGLVGLAFLPELLPDPFTGILLSAVIYAVGSGLIEVLGSPIVEACPFEHKEAAMSLLHSFYCWGTVGVILLSTLFFAVFGIGSWKILACIWAVVPLYNVCNFAVCPMAHPADSGRGTGIGGLLHMPMFWIALILMVCAGASELSMAQWASAYAESALGLSKAAGDLAASLSDAPAVGLAGCILCGFSVGILWPGTISICSGRIPAGGTAMFALLAMAGDLGGAFGPGLVGGVSQRTGDNLQRGMLAGCVFPLVLMAALFILRGLRQSQGPKPEGPSQ